VRTSLTTRRLVAGLLALAVVLTAACAGDDDDDGGTAKDSQRRQEGVDGLIADQPAETMDFSPTRETINFWIKTWSQPGKLSFVYLQAADGSLIGYYVLEGLPVSYCAALTPNYERFKVDSGDDDDDRDQEVIVPAPGVDGAYYSGGQCSAYYGKDATTGAYVEWTVGLGINQLLFDEPMPRQNDAQPLGPTAIEDVPQDQQDGVDED
jgi:hypothetical protein